MSRCPQSAAAWLSGDQQTVKLIFKPLWPLLVAGKEHAPSIRVPPIREASVAMATVGEQPISMTAVS